MTSRFISAFAALGLGLFTAAPAWTQQRAEQEREQAAPAQVNPAQLRQIDPAQLQRIDPAQIQAIDRAQFQIQDFTQLRPVIPDETRRDPRLAVIDWTAAYEDRRVEQFEYSGDATTAVTAPQSYLPQINEQSAQRIRPVHMPVLLPRRNGEATLTRMGGEPGMMVMTRAHFYDAAYHVDGMSVHVGGTRLINHRGADAARAAGLNRGRDARGFRIVRNESGLTADFTRYGAAYTVTLECGSADDPRCADETYIRDLLRRLVVAGGNPEGEG
jgi:hypothetical protein